MALKVRSALFRLAPPALLLPIGLCPGRVRADEPPAVPLTLVVREKGPDVPWTLEITHAGDRALAVAADLRLLRFEVTVPDPKTPGETKMVDCKLPESWVPEAAPTPHLLRPLESLLWRFDPRFFCMSEDTLVPGAILTPMFGWPLSTKIRWRNGKRVEEVTEQSAPFVASEAPADPPARFKQVVGEPFSLGDAYRKWQAPEEPQAALELKMTHGSDAHDERDVVVGVTLLSHGDQPQKIFIRRELLRFTVLGPDGMSYCRADPDQRAPDAAAFQTLQQGRITLQSRLVEICPRGTFSRPGLYWVKAQFHAQNSGDGYGFEAFTGVLEAKAPTAVRVAKGTLPFAFAPINVAPVPSASSVPAAPPDR